MIIAPPWMRMGGREGPWVSAKEACQTDRQRGLGEEDRGLTPSLPLERAFKIVFWEGLSGQEGLWDVGSEEREENVCDVTAACVGRRTLA